jgi:hypothetical protein
MATFPERQKQSNFQFSQYRAYGAQHIDYQSRNYLDFRFPQPGTRRPHFPALIVLSSPSPAHEASPTLECPAKDVFADNPSQGCIVGFEKAKHSTTTSMRTQLETTGTLSG